MIADGAQDVLSDNVGERAGGHFHAAEGVECVKNLQSWFCVVYWNSLVYTKVVLVKNTYNTTDD